VCRAKQLFAASARFYTEAFAENPALAQDMRTRARYWAACVAALAAAGKGKDADKPDAAAQTALRKHVLEWLRADLTFWTQVADSGQPQARGAVLTTLQQWQATPDLASLRDPQALKALDLEQRRGFVKLWQDVGKLLDRVREPGRGGR
jgi:hypothetical protein